MVISMFSRKAKFEHAPFATRVLSLSLVLENSVFRFSRVRFVSPRDSVPFSLFIPPNPFPFDSFNITLADKRTFSKITPS